MLYKDSGVDIEKGNEFVRFIKSKLKRQKTFYPDFAFTLPLKEIIKKYREPYLVYSTDGIGTKIKLAIQYNHVKHLGQDLVAMCVNDILVLGAKPLVFLDYIAVSDIKSPYIKPFMEGLLDVLEKEGIELGGGETAELPDLLNENEFDVAGFVIGIVSRDMLTKSENIKEEDVIIGFPSSGVHANGYSLVRAVLSKNKIEPEKVLLEEKTLLDILLEPTKIYVKELLPFFRKGIIHGAAHITGGGILENLRRTLNHEVDAVVHKDKINVLPIFRYLKETGKIPEEEMWRVFNMGIGFIIITGKEEAHTILSQTDGYIIGEIKKGSGRVILEEGN